MTHQKKKTRVSLADVAREANVSKSTVSLVLNSRDGRIPLTDESIRRVRQAVGDLGYRPNLFARGLAAGRSRLQSLAVVIAHDHVLTGHVVSQALAGITQRATESGYSCAVLAPRGDPGRAFTEHPIFKERLVEGVIALAWESVEQECLHAIREQGLPFISVHMEPADATIPCVTSDDFGNAYKATEHLHQLGHRRFAFVGGPINGDAANQRIAGFSRFLTEHDLEDRQDRILRGDYATVDRASFESMMGQADRPTAILAVSDVVAATSLSWLKSLGLRVPEDVAIVGFDDDPIGRFLDPPLTTIKATAAYQGELAASMTLDLIAGRQIGRSRVALPGQLLIRGSTESRPR